MTQQLWLADTLRDAGLDVAEVVGWQASGGSTFDPVGVLIHHTAAPDFSISQDAPSLQVCIHGRPGIPGPLCNILIGYSGRCYLVSSGRANHAGQGGPWRTILKDQGNQHLIGIEIENNGVGQPYPRVQLDAADAATAAILAHLGRDASWCLGHKEWAPGRKVDPSFNMDAFRAVVAARLNQPEGPTVPPTTDRTDIVRQLQDWLNMAGAQPPLTLDGDPGPATLNALRAVLDYQQSEMARLTAAGTGDARLSRLAIDINAALTRAGLG